ncbi:hypothetical protein SAMN04489735_104528 [Aneurinibacillus thermoaerophilus]|uniref:Uncharacterized protein n=1 Tax=Aneurinibacillus thermoaerophilus TaxID=143495 RepID=A0A1G8EL93_ANETH|nr:hypothetical protein [Aneurinibacillus thermoaerophilus]QYY44752.1 hypothetical protein K3F53_19100 [Aneurinibacillus thermoaerophilus]SDH70637.1 hypothetical protein SAMN04489735_104528 [Aneurinibacillus thermoaerophilus]
MQQITIFEIEEQPFVPDPNKTYSPGELSAMGIEWTMEDARRWENEVWKVYHREWKKRNFINWFKAIDIYKSERDGK